MSWFPGYYRKTAIGQRKECATETLHLPTLMGNRVAKKKPLPRVAGAEGQEVESYASTIFASGAFFWTEAMPFFMTASLG